MKKFVNVLIACFVFLSNNGIILANSVEYVHTESKFQKEQVGICIFLELPSGPEIDFINKGKTGAILEELIKAIEQEIIIIVSSILLTYLKILIDEKWNNYEMIINSLDHYSFFQTNQNNFCLLVPEKSKQNSLVSLGFSNYVTITNFENFAVPLNYGINLDELKTLFIHNTLLERSIYCTGHGASRTGPDEPLIANLKLSQYKELVSFLNQLNCRLLFISSCYAAGLNMVEVHKKLLHKFPIVIGNLTDSFSRFNPQINFKKYFAIQSQIGPIAPAIEKTLFSEDFKKAIKKVCGPHVNNTPWLKLPTSEKFFLLNPNNNIIINNNEEEFYTQNVDKQDTLPQQSVIEIPDIESLLVTGINIQKTIHITGTKPPLMISVIPGQSYHIFDYVKAPNQTFYDFIDSIFSITYEFRKVFFFKKIKIKKPKRKLHKFKIIKVKNVLAINHGTHQTLLENNFFKNHELYFEKGTHYHRIQVPAGIKMGYVEMDSTKIPLSNTKALIDKFIQLSRPSEHIVKSIGELP